jgi:hypothetical protein
MNRKEFIKKLGKFLALGLLGGLSGFLLFKSDLKKKAGCSLETGCDACGLPCDRFSGKINNGSWKVKEKK